ncbi:MAG: hypothetical protein AAGA54_21005 [Myxococcota bacterium]
MSLPLFVFFLTMGGPLPSRSHLLWLGLGVAMVVAVCMYARRGSAGVFDPASTSAEVEVSWTHAMIAGVCVPWGGWLRRVTGAKIDEELGVVRVQAAVNLFGMGSFVAYEVPFPQRAEAQARAVVEAFSPPPLRAEVRRR